MRWAAFLETEYLGNAMATWGLAMMAFLATWIALIFARGFVARRLISISKKSQRLHFLNLLGNMAGKTNTLLLMLLAVLVGVKFLDIQDSAKNMINAVVIVGFLIQTGLWANSAIDYWTREYRRRYLDKDPTRVMVLSSSGLILKIVLTAVLALTAIQNMGVNVTGLIASVGIVGIGVGFALQNVMSDLFASLSIVVDRPFVLGDFIVVGDQKGVVEDIGLKTTRLRSLWGEEIVFGNNDLLASRIQNYKRMQQRRVVFKLGVIYQTPHEQLKEIPKVVREAIQGVDPLQMETWIKMAELKGEAPKRETASGEPLIRFDRGHLAAYGPSSIDYEFVYYIATSDFNLHMDVLQAIHLEVFRRFGAAGIEFAYPTQTLFIQDQRDNSAAAA